MTFLSIQEQVETMQQAYQKLVIALGCPVRKIQQRSRLNKALMRSPMDHWHNILTEPIQADCFVGAGVSIPFPPGRFHSIAAAALHVTGYELSPHLTGLDQGAAFALAQELEGLFKAAGLQEDVRKRTPRDEIERLFLNKKRMRSRHVELYEYSLGDTWFTVDITLINEREDYVITVDIWSESISDYWMDVAEEMLTVDHSNKRFGRRVDYEPYMQRLRERGYLSKASELGLDCWLDAQGSITGP